MAKKITGNCSLDHGESLTDPYNLIEVHLRKLPRLQVECTYMGITIIVQSRQLWDLIKEGRDMSGIIRDRRIYVFSKRIGYNEYYFLWHSEIKALERIFGFSVDVPPHLFYRCGPKGEILAAILPRRVYKFSELPHDQARLIKVALNELKLE